MEIIASVSKNRMEPIQQHSHFEYELIHYIEGTGALTTADAEIPFGPGTVIIVPPEVMHGSVAYEYFRNVCVHYPMSLPDLHAPISLSSKRDAGMLVDIIYRLLVEAEAKNQACVNYLIKAVEEMVRADMNIGDNRFIAAAASVYKAIVENFADENFDVASIIAATYYSDDYFRVRYRELYGMTPYGHLLNLRIDCATGLLREYGKHLTVAEISSQSGFPDPVYFSKLFKKRTGLSPKDYVKCMDKEK